MDNPAMNTKSETPCSLHQSLDMEVTVSSFSSTDSQLDCTKSKGLIFRTIFCGQILSLLLCTLGSSSTGLSTWFSIHTPLFQGFFTYLFLASTFGVALASQKDVFHDALLRRGWKYFLLAVIDVNANFLLVKAYTLTTLTSAQLCDSFTIPTVMVLSFAFLRVRYKIIHYSGVALCIIGSLILVFTDQRDQSNDSAENELIGDLLAFTGAFLYGCSNVCQEFLVKEFSHLEFLGMLGLFGSVVSAIELVVIERTAVAAISWNWQIIGLYASFAISQYLWYSLMPYVMRLSSAAVVNLSLLTSDMYTLLVGLLVFQYKFSYLYFIAFMLIIFGLIVYNLRPTPVGLKRTKKPAAVNTVPKDNEANELFAKKTNGFRYHSFNCSQELRRNSTIAHAVSL